MARAIVVLPVPASPCSTSHSRLWKCRSTAWQHFAHSSPPPTAAGSAVTGAGLTARGFGTSGAASCTCSTPPAVPRSTQLGRTCTRATTPEGRSSSSTRRSEFIASMAPVMSVAWSAGSISSRARSLLMTRSGLTANTAMLLRRQAVR